MIINLHVKWQMMMIKCRDKFCLDYWSIYLRITSEQANAHRINFFLKESIINMLVSLTHIMQLLRIYLPIKSVAILVWFCDSCLNVGRSLWSCFHCPALWTAVACDAHVLGLNVIQYFHPTPSWQRPAFKVAIWTVINISGQLYSLHNLILPEESIRPCCAGIVN